MKTKDEIFEEMNTDEDKVAPYTCKRSPLLGNKRLIGDE